MGRRKKLILRCDKSFIRVVNSSGCKELDNGTGLEYYGARYYDPSKASQFISPDSVS